MTRTKTRALRAPTFLALPFVSLPFVLLLLSPGCGTDDTAHPTSAASVPAMCQARPDDTTPGCFANASSMLCSPSGCQSLCKDGQTPVVCLGAQATGPIPTPDANAGCTVVAIPTPSNELFYCCPCGSP